MIQKFLSQEGRIMITIENLRDNSSGYNNQRGVAEKTKLRTRNASQTRILSSWRKRTMNMFAELYRPYILEEVCLVLWMYLNFALLPKTGKPSGKPYSYWPIHPLNTTETGNDSSRYGVV